MATASIRAESRHRRDLCDENSASSCTVTGLLEFEAISPARNERSFGGGRLLSIRSSTPHHGRYPLIMREFGKIIEAKKVPIFATPKSDQLMAH